MNVHREITRTFVLETLSDNPAVVIQAETDRTSSWRAETSSTLEMGLYCKVSSAYVIRVEPRDKERAVRLFMYIVKSRGPWYPRGDGTSR